MNARFCLVLLCLAGLGACTTPHRKMRAGPGMGDTGMPAAMKHDATQLAIERALAAELAGHSPPRDYADWREYWSDCLWHWHYTEDGGNKWLVYTVHRREELHLPAIWNWS